MHPQNLKSKPGPVISLLGLLGDSTVLLFKRDTGSFEDYVFGGKGSGVLRVEERTLRGKTRKVWMHGLRSPCIQSKKKFGCTGPAGVLLRPKRKTQSRDNDQPAGAARRLDGFAFQTRRRHEGLSFY